MAVISSSLLANAALSSSPHIDTMASIDVIKSIRDSLVDIAFPYAKVDHERVKREDYDRYFDELDARDRAKRKIDKDGDDASSGGSTE